MKIESFYLLFEIMIGKNWLGYKEGKREKVEIVIDWKEDRMEDEAREKEEEKSNITCQCP